MNKGFSVFLLLLVSQLALAQLPETDIWLFKIKREKNEPAKPEDGQNISSRKGYDNQPSFSPDGKHIYYSSVRDDNQADIYIYTIGNKKTSPLTVTKESEYTPVQREKGKSITSVTVEKDSAQRVHFIDPETGAHASSIETDSIGYYSFVNADTMLYYKLTSPHSLRYHVRSSGEDRLIAASPIRSFGPLTRHSVYFGIKDTSKVTVYVYDFHLRKSTRIASYDNLNEDIQWHPEWGLLRSEETRILQFDEKTQTWKELFNLQGTGIKKISRFTIDRSTKHMAVVDNQ